MKDGVARVIQAQLDAVDLGGDGVQTWWRIFSFDEKTGIIKKMVAQPNLIAYQGADILAKLISGDITWQIGAMFFEFENTAGVPTRPSPQRDENIDYYIDDLSLEPNKDYVRVPLIIPAALTAQNSNYDGNQATFFAVTSGVTGIHGKTFAQGSNSKVYGVALAATPTVAEYTQDKLFSRSYSGFDPVPKEDGHQIGAQYLIRFR
jgi:hypothetical protein